MKVWSSLKIRWLTCLLALVATFVYAAVDQGYEDANNVPGTCPTNGSSYTDAWGFSACNCTSYVAYRLRLNDVRHNNVLFTNTAWGVQWSNANLWNDTTKINTVGIRRDKYPAVGSVAHWNANENGAATAGHVAYVQHLFTRPSDGRLTGIGVMEYNFTSPHLYTYRRIGTDASGYPGRFLHFEEKGRDATATNATCVTIDQGTHPSGANPGTFCWKHVSNSDDTCDNASDRYYYDYKSCQKYPVNSDYCSAVRSSDKGYKAKIGSWFPEPIDPAANGTDFATCAQGGSGGYGGLTYVGNDFSWLYQILNSSIHD